MNERILELYKQASDQDYFPRDDEEVYMSPKNLEKFAELIVRECAGTVEETRWMVPPSQEQIARSIREHFGVE